MKAHHAIVFVIAALFFMVLCLNGCKCPEYITGENTERIVEVHHRDTTIITQADSASIVALFRCDSAYNVVVEELYTIQGERIATSAKTSKKGNALQVVVDCKEDSLMHEIHLRDSVIKCTTSQTIVKEVEVKGFVYYCGVALLIMLALLTLWGVVSTILKFV